MDPAEWKNVRFGDVCEHSAFGPRFSGDLYAPNVGNVATLRTTDIRTDGRMVLETMPLAQLEASKFTHHFLQTGDLVITRSGRIGTASLFKGFRLPVLPGAFLIRFRLKAELADPLFFQYFFNSSIGQTLLRSVATGSVQQNLNITSVHELEVPLPPRTEQRAIAHVLGSLDDKIELNRRMNATLEAMARALFRSWFVDFDPVRAKMEGRPTGLPDEVAALFPERMIESEMGEVPVGWSTRKLEDIVNLQVDRVEATPDKDDEKYIAIDHMPQRSVSLATWGSGKDVNSSIVRFQKGDVLFASMRPYFHKVGMAPFDGITRTTTFVLRPTLSPAFCLFALSSDEMVERATSASVGTTIPYVRWDAMKNFPVLVPDSRVTDEFGRLVGPLVERIEINNQQCRTLASLRDLLLPKLLSGELRVPLEPAHV